jgi:ribosomal subunit interface protein
MARLPIEITVKDVPNTESIETRILEKAEKLTHFYDRIEYCKVVVSAAQKHKLQGKLFTTHIELKVPGKLLVANHKVNENLYITIRDAFAAIQRQLEAYAQKQRGAIKKHMEVRHGKVVRLYEDYGFIRALDGSEYYFHADNFVGNNFNLLKVETPVSFIEFPGGDGLQAAHVCNLNVEVITIAA